MNRFNILLGGFTLLFFANVQANVIYSFSVDGGTDTEIKPLSGTQSAAEYYDFQVVSGGGTAYESGYPNPAYGPENATAFFWLYEETDTNILSIGVTFDDLGGSRTIYGSAHFTLSGMPSGWEWVVEDDNSEISNSTDTTPSWDWNQLYGDGGVISNLENSEWTIDWLATSNANNFNGIDNWYFLSDGAGKYDNIFNLNPGSTLSISAKNIVTTNSVPEPSVLALFIAGLFGMVLSKNRSRKI